MRPLPRLEEMLAAAQKAGKVGPATFAERGRILVMGMTGMERPDAPARRARNDLQTLGSALRSRREASPDKRYPTTTEGLASLASDPEALDEFLGVIPKDPWGHPYHYVSPHPKKPDEIDLRSAGPDGEIDTEDDVFPEE